MDPAWKEWLERHRQYKYMSFGRYDYRVTELARDLGVSRMTVHRWIRGKGPPAGKYSGKIKEFIEKRESFRSKKEWYGK